MRLLCPQLSLNLILALGVAFGATERASALAEDTFGSASAEDREPSRDRGWSGPWAGDAMLASAADMQAASGSLPLPAGVTPPPSGGRVVGFSGLAFRGLAVGEELQWQSPEPWLIRIAVRRTAVDAGAVSVGVNLLFHDRLQRVVLAGCTTSGRMVIVHGRTTTASEDPVNGTDHGYVWLVKFDAPDPEGRRVIRLRSFHESEPWPNAEPEAWTISTEPIPGDATIDRIGIAAGANVLAELDEFRIARSWTQLNAAPQPPDDAPKQ